MDDILDTAKRVLGIGIGLLVASAGAAFAFHHAHTGDLLHVFAAAFLGWTGYLFAHYAATGKFIHQSQAQHVLPQRLDAIAAGLAGISVLVTGTGIGALALSLGDPVTASIGFLDAAVGYLITHYAFTGQLL